MRREANTMKDLTGKTIAIAGMLIEVLSVDGEDLKCRNLTTKAPLLMKRAVVDRAIRLGQAEVVDNP